MDKSKYSSYMEQTGNTHKTQGGDRDCAFVYREAADKSKIKVDKSKIKADKSKTKVDKSKKTDHLPKYKPYESDEGGDYFGKQFNGLNYDSEG